MSGRRRSAASLSDRPLSDRQRLFVAEYLIDLNIAAAARRAGYAGSTAHAPDKLITPAVEQAIEDAIERRRTRTAVDADRVVAELAKLAFSNMADFFTVGDDGLPRFDLGGLAREDAAAIQSLTVDYWRPPIVRKRDRTSNSAHPREGGDPSQGGRQARTAEDLPRRADVPITPRRIRIQLADKRAALVDLARHLGVEAPADRRDPDAIETTKDGAPIYKFIHMITGVPHHSDPTGKKGFMMQIAGPRAPHHPEPPMTEAYRQALATLSPEDLADGADEDGDYTF